MKPSFTWKFSILRKGTNTWERCVWLAKKFLRSRIYFLKSKFWICEPFVKKCLFCRWTWNLFNRMRWKLIKFCKKWQPFPIKWGEKLPRMTYVMRFRKPRLRMKSVDFNFDAKSSSTDYNESNKWNPKTLAHMGSEKSLVELGVPKNKLSRKSKSTIWYTKSCEKLQKIVMWR